MKEIFTIFVNGVITSLFIGTCGAVIATAFTAPLWIYWLFTGAWPCQ